MLYFNFTKTPAAFCPSNRLIKGHIFIYCIMCLKSHFVRKKLWENGMSWVNRYIPNEQTLITIYFHCMEKSSKNILLNVSFCVLSNNYFHSMLDHFRTFCTSVQRVYAELFGHWLCISIHLPLNETEMFVPLNYSVWCFFLMSPGKSSLKCWTCFISNYVLVWTKLNPANRCINA